MNNEEPWQILIIDDSPDDRAEMRQLLLNGSERRVRFAEAATGAAGLRAYLERRPDCVLLDYHLPDYDARELLSLLGAGGDSPRCPVVVVTGSSGLINSRILFELGAQDFISKDWMNPDSISRIVENSIERYRLGRELKASQTQLRSFLENSATVAWMKDHEGRYVYLSPTFERRFDTRFEDWNGKTDFDVFPNRLAEQLRGNDLEVLATGRPLEFTEEVPNPDGGPSWWVSHIFPFTDEAGRCFIGGLAVDITEREEAARVLRQSEEAERRRAEELAALMELAPLAIFVSHDPECRAIVGNRMANRLFENETSQNLSVGSIAGERQDFVRRFFKNDREVEPSELPMQRAVKDGVPIWNDETQVVLPSQRKIFLLGSADPLFDTGGKVRGCIGAFIDITERKRTEDALRESEALNRGILNSSADCIKVIDLAGNLILMNGPGQCAMEIEDFTVFEGRPWHSLWPDAGRELVDEALRIARAGKVGRFQGYCPTAKGTPKWWDVVVTAMRDIADQPIRFVSISRDITERKRIGDALRAVAEIDAYRVALSDALRPLANPTEIQAVGARLLGEHLRASRVHYAEISEDGVTGLVCADYCDGVSSVVGRHRLKDYGLTAMSEFRVGRILVVPDVARDSRLSPAEKTRTSNLAIGAYVLVPIVKGGEAGALLVVHQTSPRNWTDTEIALIKETADRTWDAVERGRIATTLRAREARLAALVDQAAAGLAETDLMGRFTLVNDRYCAMVGRSREELLALRWHDIIQPEDVDRNRAHFEICVTDGRDFIIEERYVRPDGSTVWARNCVSITRDVAGRSISLLLASFDIGERRKIEAKLHEQSRQLREADRRKDEFMATLAHELRNPLAPICMAAKLLQRTGLDSSQLAWCGDVIGRQSGQLTRLVNDLLDIARITQDKIELKRERVGIADIVEWALETTRPVIEAHRHELSVHLPPDPLWVDGDPVRLTQVLSNLLNNAAKYTADGGTISLTARRQGDEAAVCIRDTGIGIDNALLVRVFDPFIQVDRTSRHSQGGLGIGLALVRGLVHRHGGRVEARSEGLGRGSEFVVHLPLVDPRSVDEMPQEEEVSASCPPRRILVVDDNHDNADSIGMLLATEGAAVHITYDGPSALDALDAFQPTTVILDIGLPGMDGFEIARKIRQQPRFQDVTLIALTGWGQDEDQRRSSSAGFDHHLTKPLDLDKLQEILKPSETGADDIPS